MRRSLEFDMRRWEGRKICSDTGDMLLGLVSSRQWSGYTKRWMSNTQRRQVRCMAADLKPVQLLCNFVSAGLEMKKPRT